MKQILTGRFRATGNNGTAHTGWARMPVEDYVEFRAYLIEELFGSLLTLTQFDPVHDSDIPLVVARALNARPGPRGISLIMGEFDAAPVYPTRQGTEYAPWHQLWREQHTVWAIIDAVAWPESLDTLRRDSINSLCLYSTPDPDKQAAAPWLCRMDERSELTRNFMALPETRHGGILFTSNRSAAALRMHFRRFTMAWLPNHSAPVYFRFYDPRVFMDMTKALKAERLAAISAPVGTFYIPRSADSSFDAEAEAGPLMVFRAPKAEPVHGNFVLNLDEMACFDEVYLRRLILRIARKLSRAAGQSYGLEACLKATQDAVDIGRRFGMESKAQISVLARAVLMFGTNFWQVDAEAHGILSSDDLAFQRKDRLMGWMVDKIGQTSRSPVKSFRLSN